MNGRVIRAAFVASIVTLLLTLVNGASAAATRTCDTVKVPTCVERINRDVVFLVDASESLLPSRFYKEMLDYLQSLWCALNSGFVNRGSVITFGRDVRVVVPFQQYTTNQWFNAIEALRSDSSLCCKCCTPTAEAFTLARNLLSNNQIPGERSTVIFVVTDGDPWQNKDATPGTIWRFPKHKPATYRYNIVPREANLLKNAFPDTRIMLVGVPNRFDDPPAIGYFSGILDPSKRPKKGKKGKKQCIKRAGKTTCAKMLSPPFPIVSLPIEKNLFSAGNWDVKDLLNQTATDLCRIRETGAPTQSPTQPLNFEGLDVYLYLDRSRSMQWHSDVCRSAPGANPSAKDNQVCWQLFVRFAESFVRNATQLRWPSPSSPLFGWQADRPLISQGVRVWLYGFACSDGQSVPIVEKIGETINSAAAFQEALERARQLTPTGGTCPSATLERSLGQIMAHDLLARPYKVGVLITDGVFYDMPKPEISFKGLHHFGMMTYALGIAIPNNGNNFGLTPGEIALQKSQLTAFVNGQSDRVLNFGAEGLLLLDNIASSIVAGLPDVVESTFPRVLEQPYYCGFTNNERCLNTDPSTFNSKKYCKWIPNDWKNFEGNGRCMDKKWCGWVIKAECKQDNFCQWQSKKCVPK